VAPAGVILTLTGGKTQICADADCAGFATLVAVTVTPCHDEREAGAV
jgi:hypothetical protein